MEIQSNSGRIGQHDPGAARLAEVRRAATVRTKSNAFNQTGTRIYS